MNGSNTFVTVLSGGISGNEAVPLLIVISGSSVDIVAETFVAGWKGGGLLYSETIISTVSPGSALPSLSPEESSI